MFFFVPSNPGPVFFCFFVVANTVNILNLFGFDFPMFHVSLGSGGHSIDPGGSMQIYGSFNGLPLK